MVIDRRFTSSASLHDDKLQGHATQITPCRASAWPAAGFITNSMQPCFGAGAPQPQSPGSVCLASDEDEMLHTPVLCFLGLDSLQ